MEVRDPEEFKRYKRSMKIAGCSTLMALSLTAGSLLFGIYSCTMDLINRPVFNEPLQRLRTAFCETEYCDDCEDEITRKEILAARDQYLKDNGLSKRGDWRVTNWGPCYTSGVRSNLFSKGSLKIVRDPDTSAIDDFFEN